MKKLAILSVPLTLISIGLSDKVEATTSQTYDSQTSVGFGEGGGIQEPVNPNQPDPTSPVKPQNPDGTKPSPGGEGSLTVDFASSFDFGNHDISNVNQTYQAKAQKYFGSDKFTPNYIQVTDRRGTFGGWDLKVKESTQFTEVATGPQKYKELKGASIALKNPILDSNSNVGKPNAQEVLQLLPGVETQIAKAENGQGAGTWVIRWGEQESISKKGETPNVTLFVPGNTPKDAAAYTTTLHWILSDLPANALPTG